MPERDLTEQEPPALFSLHGRMGLFGKEHKKVAAEFVLEKAADFHVAFGTTPAIYNEVREQIEPLPATADLEESLAAYNESVDPQFRFDVQKCTFEDVLTEVEHARGAYEENAQGVRGMLHRGVRFVGEYADQITPWIARQNAANRDKILGAFEDIPNLILSVKARQNQWATAKALRTSAIQLYETLARAMARLIFLLNGSMSHEPRWGQRALKVLKRLGASAHTSHSIDAILAGVQKQADLFKECLDKMRDQRAIDTGADAAATKAIAEKTYAKLTDMALESDNNMLS
ncbi:hypothetical protein BDW66DRAFT_155363 [Aspergillus desertorum]